MADASTELAAGEQFLGRLEYDQAYKHFDKATKLDPENASAYFGEDDAAIGNQQKQDEAIMRLYKKAIHLDPKTHQ
jgi:tetratricopeptide (TPR) repeat protein